MQKQTIAVCHLTSSHLALDTRIFDKEAVSLAKAGYDVAVIGQHDKAERVNGVRIVPLRKRAGRFKRYVIGTWDLLRHALREKAKVYHFHDPELIPVGVLLKCLGKKVVYDVHEDYQQLVMSRAWVSLWIRRPLSAMWWWCEKTCSWFYDAILTRDTELAKKFSPRKTKVITNCPPLHFLGVGAREENDTFNIAFVGAIDEERCIFQVIEALEHTQHREIELHVMGKCETPKLLDTFKNHPQIVFHGRIPWEQLRKNLETSSLGLLLFQPTPALLALTGEGNTKLFEFMALGLPVLISDFPRLKEFVCSNGAGYPVDATDPKKIAEAIDYLYENPALRDEMGENGKRAVRERYHWEYEEKVLLEVYGKIAPLRPQNQS